MKDYFEPLPVIPELTELELYDYLEYIQDYAELMIRTGNEVKARQLLTLLTGITIDQLNGAVDNRTIKYQAARLRYLWFRLTQEDLAARWPILSSVKLDSQSEYRNCFEADLGAKLASIEGNWAAVRQQVDYLLAHHYRHPGFIQFCKRYQFCAAKRG